MNYLGNREILQYPKTAFLCSRKVPASIVLKSYDWAKKMRDQGRCVIIGNHSPIEKDVFHFLLKGDQPLILALARGIKKRSEPEYEDHLQRNRLLIITTFHSSVMRVTQQTANRRNRFISDHSEEIFIAYAQPSGNLEELIFEQLKKGKVIKTFDVIENEIIINAGAKPFSFEG